MAGEFEHEILRDDWGIPHIWASSPAGALYGQGRACALDRAWQIEFLRLRAEGRTAEAFGSSAVDWDRFARRSGMERSARTVYERSSPRTRELLDAYVAGSTAPWIRRRPRNSTNSTTGPDRGSRGPRLPSS